MMKRLSLFIMMAVMGMATVLAGPKDKANPDDFLKRYEAVIEKVDAIDPDNVDVEKLDDLKKQYKELTKELSQHKKAMSNDQVKAYYKLKARYQKKIATLKTRRSAKEIEGWFEGMF